MSQPDLTILRRYLLAKLGLKFNNNQEDELYLKMKAAAKDFNFHDTPQFIQWLTHQSLSEEETERLATHLTIGETYFFRERKALDYLERIYFPQLIEKRKHSKSKRQIKIWSAGCSSGEEPYSIAIILKRLLPDIAHWNIHIEATDINPKFLDKARRGIYSKWSFRGMTPDEISQHFEVVDHDHYQIDPSIRNRVNFSSLNLKTNHYYAPGNNLDNIDVILCRNVLIYFSNEGINNIVSKFYNTLGKQGVLVVSPVEVASIVPVQFTHYFYQGITILAKNLDEQHSEHPVLKKKPVPVKTIKKTLASLPKTDLKASARKASSAVLLNSIVNTPGSKPEPDTVLTYKQLKQRYEEDASADLEDLITKALLQDRKNRDHLYVLQARIKADKGLLQEAEELCLKAIEVDKINCEAHYLLATVRHELAKTSEAITSLHNTLFIDPGFAMGHFLLGNIFLQEGKNTLAMKHFRNALKSLSKLAPDKLIDKQHGLTAGNLSDLINSMVE